jgi:hypothetical protein
MCDTVGTIDTEKRHFQTSATPPEETTLFLICTFLTMGLYAAAAGLFSHDRRRTSMLIIAAVGILGAILLALMVPETASADQPVLDGYDAAAWTVTGIIAAELYAFGVRHLFLPATTTRTA